MDVVSHEFVKKYKDKMRMHTPFYTHYAGHLKGCDFQYLTGCTGQTMIGHHSECFDFITRSQVFRIPALFWRISEAKMRLVHHRPHYPCRFKDGTTPILPVHKFGYRHSKAPYILVFHISCWAQIQQNATDEERVRTESLDIKYCSKDTNLYPYHALWGFR